MNPFRAALVALSLALTAQNVCAQGTVQEDPRRPAPPQDTPGCEIWEGTIVGNDPSAIAYFQLCGGDQVTGVFLFTSLRSGWSRHRVAGTWTAQHTRISLRDLGLDEKHELNGWSLCAADTYDLRVTRPTHIDGTFVSAECRDHGEVTLDLTSPNVPMAPPRLPSPPSHAPANAGGLRRSGAPNEAHHDAPTAPRSRIGCAVGEASGSDARSPWGWCLAVGAVGAVRAIRRGRRTK